MSCVGVLAITAVMFITTPRELAPEEDQGILLSMIKTPQSGNLDYTESATQKLWQIVETIPEKAHLFVINGFQGVHASFAGILLKPWDQRTRTQKQILQNELQAKLATISTASAPSRASPTTVKPGVAEINADR